MRMRAFICGATLALALTAAGCGAGSGGRVTATSPVVAGGGDRPAQAMPSQAEIDAALVKFGNSQRPVFCGGKSKRWVAFTFDDGPGPYTRTALAILRRGHIPATFFIVGRNVQPYNSSLRAERNYNAAFGDHSWSHPLLTSLPAGEQRAQLLDTKNAIQGTTKQRVRLFRPPYGAHDAATDKIARRAGMATILWNVDSQDSLGASHKKIAKLVKQGLKPGSIILMHENHGQTLRALRYTLLPALKHHNITLVTVPQMLAGNPPTQAQLARGRKGCS